MPSTGQIQKSRRFEEKRARDFLLREALPYHRHPTSTEQTRTQKLFSPCHLRNLERLSGLNLSSYFPRKMSRDYLRATHRAERESRGWYYGPHARYRYPHVKVFSFDDLSRALSKASRAYAGDPPYLENYRAHLEHYEDVKAQLKEIETNFSTEEQQVIEKLVNRLTRNLTKKIDTTTLARLEYLTDLKPNYILYANLKLPRSSSLGRYYSPEELKFIIMEATLACLQRPFYLRNNYLDYKIPKVLIETGLQREVCEHGYSLWSQRIKRICHLMGQDPRTMPEKELEKIIFRAGSHNFNLDHSIRTTPQYKDTPDDVALIKRYLLIESETEFLARVQRQIKAGASCAPPL